MLAFMVPFKDNVLWHSLRSHYSLGLISEVTPLLLKAFSCLPPCKLKDGACASFLSCQEPNTMVFLVSSVELCLFPGVRKIQLLPWE